MKRVTCRTLAAIVGLTVGWYLAGMAGPHMPFVGVSFAESDSSEHPSHNSNDQHKEHTNPAETLVPRESVAWIRPVLWGAGGLFVAALLIGPLVLKLSTPKNSAAPDDHHE